MKILNTFFARVKQLWRVGYPVRCVQQCRIKKLEQKKVNNQALPFRIKEIREKGFIVKAGNLTAFVSFYHMPWQYRNHKFWNVVFPFIQKKEFTGKVYSISHYPLSVTIDGKADSLKPADFIPNCQYRGIVIAKKQYGLIVDFGSQFNWECGSLIAYVHFTAFNPGEFEAFSIGQTVKLPYRGVQVNGNRVFSRHISDSILVKGTLTSFYGREVEVKVLKGHGQSGQFIVEGKYNALIPHGKRQYPNKLEREELAKALNSLQHNEIIHCEVVRFDFRRNILLLRWCRRREINRATGEEQHSASLIPRGLSVQKNADNSLPPNLKIIGAVLNVEVVKRRTRKGKEITTYRVMGKYKVNLHITNDHNSMSNKNKVMIEKNLKDADIIICKVIKIKQNTLVVKWPI